MRRKGLQTGAMLVFIGMMLALAGVLAGCGDDASGTPSSAALLSGAGVANTVTVSGDATVTSPPDEAVRATNCLPS
jgi:hypothetical protein